MSESEYQDHIIKGKPLFPLGRIVATAWVAENLLETTIRDLISRHVSGDYGDLREDDIAANNAAISGDGRILSCYTVAEERLYVITEHDRSVTTVMLAEEY